MKQANSKHALVGLKEGKKDEQMDGWTDGWCVKRIISNYAQQEF